MKRGAVVVVALPKEFGKPRPVLVIQTDLFNPTHPTVTVLPLTTTIRHAAVYRLTVEPANDNGLREVSQIMVDKATTVLRENAGPPIGSMDEATMQRVSRALAVWLGLG